MGFDNFYAFGNCSVDDQTAARDRPQTFAGYVTHVSDCAATHVLASDYVPMATCLELCSAQVSCGDASSGVGPGVACSGWGLAGLC